MKKEGRGYVGFLGSQEIHRKITGKSIGHRKFTGKSQENQ
jgi:hypothetical protein